MNKQIKNKKGQVLVELKNVRKEYGQKDKKVVAIADLSFKIIEGENISLVGANGAGKTTAVEMIMKINNPTKGHIYYPFVSKKDKVNKYLGIQFQDSIYPQYISVKSIVNFIINAYNLHIKENELKELVEAFKIEKFYTRRASALSGGQSQRLNILLALLHKPKVVILDELSTGLDITTRNEFKKFIKLYAKKHHITIVLISHDSGEIFDMTDKILILKAGKVVREIPTKSFANSNELEKYIEHNIN
ncbi:MAG: ABC transporter ATP-binding protein [Mycoplasmataceae bacterium]|jgi:ABC-2 type transport system ATP-binding protein|nr:ABC transporter ATP-binding protein [Mycoplasmataceae bacterium]